MIEPPRVPPLSDALFPSRAALFAWLTQHGIAHVARLRLDAVCARLDPELRPLIRTLGARRRLIELASREAVAPRCRPAGDALRFDASVPGFRYVDPEEVEATARLGRGFIRPEVTLAPSVPRIDCSCGAAVCVHALAAIDAALAWLHQPTSASFERALVIHLDPWWNAAVEDQASDRAHRLGQTRPVTIYRLVALGTIEEQMLSLHEHKRALIEQTLAGKDAAALSTAELVAMLSASAASPDV